MQRKPIPLLTDTAQQVLVAFTYRALLALDTILFRTLDCNLELKLKCHYHSDLRSKAEKAERVYHFEAAIG